MKKRTVVISLLFALCMTSVMFGGSFLSAFADGQFHETAVPREHSDEVHVTVDKVPDALEIPPETETADDSKKNEPEVKPETMEKEPITPAAAPARPTLQPEACIQAEEPDSQPQTAKLSAPNNLVSQRHPDCLILSWDPVPTATAYTIYASLAEDGPYLEFDASADSCYVYDLSQIPSNISFTIYVKVEAQAYAYENSDPSEPHTLVVEREIQEDDLEEPSELQDLGSICFSTYVSNGFVLADAVTDVNWEGECLPQSIERAAQPYD